MCIRDRSYLLFNPARKLLKDRQDRIESDINTAIADKESAAALKAEYEGCLLYTSLLQLRIMKRSCLSHM